MKNIIVLIALLSLMATLSFGCSEGGLTTATPTPITSENDGNFRLLISDEANEINNFSSLNVTITRYNELARLGKDLDFGKRPDRLSPVDKPPYYAGKGGFNLLVVLGGLNVNPKLQPLDKDWKVIPGLYAAGNTIGNFYSGDYSTMCPGLSHGMVIHFGRVAGLNAAKDG